jgi:hypothetical protein
MNVFDEFSQIIAQLESRKIRYALVGGVAVAFYAEPRFTQDVDLLLDPGSFEDMRAVLEAAGYFESATPWTFQGTALTLHRFLKVVDEEHMIIDILLAGDAPLLEIVRSALEARSAFGVARVARKADIIRLKRQRNSLQDQADIERLEHEDD